MQRYAAGTLITTRNNYMTSQVLQHVVKYRKINKRYHHLQYNICHGITFDVNLTTVLNPTNPISI